MCISGNPGPDACVFYSPVCLPEELRPKDNADEKNEHYDDRSRDDALLVHSMSIMILCQDRVMCGMQDRRKVRTVESSS